LGTRRFRRRLRRPIPEIRLNQSYVSFVGEDPLAPASRDFADDSSVKQSMHGQERRGKANARFIAHRRQRGDRRSLQLREYGKGRSGAAWQASDPRAVPVRVSAHGAHHGATPLEGRPQARKPESAGPVPLRLPVARVGHALATRRDECRYRGQRCSHARRQAGVVEQGVRRETTELRREDAVWGFMRGRNDHRRRG